MLDFDLPQFKEPESTQNPDELVHKLMDYTMQCYKCLEETRYKLYAEFVDHQEDGMPWKNKDAKKLFLEIGDILNEMRGV